MSQLLLAGGNALLQTAVETTIKSHGKAHPTGIPQETTGEFRVPQQDLAEGAAPASRQVGRPRLEIAQGVINRPSPLGTVVGERSLESVGKAKGVAPRGAGQLRRCQAVRSCPRPTLHWRRQLLAKDALSNLRNARLPTFPARKQRRVGLLYLVAEPRESIETIAVGGCVE